MPKSEHNVMKNNHAIKVIIGHLLSTYFPPKLFKRTCNAISGYL